MLPDEVREAVKMAERFGVKGHESVLLEPRHWQTIRAHLLAREAEVEALRACALKYLGWLDVQDPASGLESDLRNPDMCGTAHLSENSSG